MEIRELNDRLVQNLEAVLDYLLPQGVKRYDEYCVGSVNGEPGDSLRVNMRGSKRGVWCDFSNESDKGDMVDLWKAVTGTGIQDACNDIRQFLGIQDDFKPRQKKFQRPEFPPYIPEPNEVLKYLTDSRKLSTATLNSFGVQWDKSAYILPSYRNDELIHWKRIGIHRPQGKKQVQVSEKTEPVLFGWQAVDREQRHILICEGEVDAMSFREYGIIALSVPFGGGSGKKQQWIDNEVDSLSVYDTIYLAMDTDQEGFEAVKEIVSRLGQHRCKVVELPMKDCNDCLREGVEAEVIHQAIRDARSVPAELLRAEKMPTHQPPHNTTLENYVLSWLLNNYEDPHLLFAQLVPEDFFHPSHQAIFSVAKELYQLGQSLGIANITDRLVAKKLMGELVAQGHLDDLRLVIPDGDIVEVCKSVRGFATLRLLEQTGTHISRLAATEGNSLQAVTRAQEHILTIVRREMHEENLISTADAMESVMQGIYEAMENPGGIRGIETGFTKFDHYTGGLEPGNMVCIAARPSMGKTAYALNIAHHVASTSGKSVAIFSLEMQRKELLQRLLSVDSGVDCRKLKDGNISQTELAAIRKSYANLMSLPIFIDDSSSMTPGRMRLICESAVMKGKSELGLVIIDYLQLMTPDSEKKQDSTNDRIQSISKAIKANAKHLDCPIITLAQLSREVERRPNKRPMLSDLRDSGAIEQDSDIVTFLYRDDYYHRDSKKPGICETIIAKQRSGKTGVFDMIWQSETTRFVNMIDNIREEMPPL